MIRLRHPALYGLLLLVPLAIGARRSPYLEAVPQPYDLIIRDGRLLDGTGSPWKYADVAIEGDRIVAVGSLGNTPARRTIDASGLYVSPGFIDVHSHAGRGLTTPELSPARPLLTQGITTVLLNPDGGGPVSMERQRAALLRDGLGVNTGLLIPHGSVRRTVLGMEDRAPAPAELDSMARLVRAAMEAGAFGLSSGLYYAPGSYAKTEEVVALSKVAAEYGGAYTSHIRDESDYTVGVVAAVDEVIRIAREARLPGIVTHVKALGPRVWGYSQAIVERIERARAGGVEVYADQYPYSASGTGIVGALVPRWAQVGGRDSLLARIDDPALQARLRRDMLENFDRRGGADRLLISTYAPNPNIEGKTLQEIAADRGVAPVDLAMAMLEDGDAGLISFNMIERDVETLMRQPWTMTASDGGLAPPGQGLHPRGFGTFPRKIRRYVIERGTVSLSHAIHSMTGLPASVFRIGDRGILREGAAADLVIFDLDRIADRSTFLEPQQLSEGMVYVIVNGTLAIDGGEFTGAMAGRVLDRRETGDGRRETGDVEGTRGAERGARGLGGTEFREHQGDYRALRTAYRVTVPLSIHRSVVPARDSVTRCAQRHAPV